MEALLAKLNNVASRVPYYCLSQSKPEKPAHRLRLSVAEPSKSTFRPQTRVRRVARRQRCSENLRPPMLTISRGIRLVPQAEEVRPLTSHYDSARAGRYNLTLELPKIRTLHDHN